MRRSLAILTASVVGATLVASPASADWTWYDPPLVVANKTTLLDTGYSDLVLSTATGQIFASNGRGHGTVTVFDLDGNVVDTIAGQTGATGLELSPDGSTVFAALTEAGSISAIDVATRTEKSRWTIGDSTCPYDLALAAGKLWFSHGCYSSGPGSIGSLDPTDPAATPTLSQGGWLTYAPRLESGSINDTLLFAVEEGVYPNKLISFDLSSGQPVRRTALEQLESVTQFRVDPDGRSVIVATPGQYQNTSKVARYATADLSQLGEFSSPGEVNSITTSADGRVAMQTRDGTIGMWAKGEYDFRWRAYTDFSPGLDAADRGLAIGLEGRFYAVQKSLSDTMMSLTTVDVQPVDTTFSVDNPVMPALVRKPYTITGRLDAADGSPTGVRTIHVTRYDARGSVDLPDVQTAADGTFSVTDTPRTEGDTSWVFTFSGTERLLSSTYTVTLPVTRK